MAYATRAELVTFSLPAGALTSTSTDKQDAALEAASRMADGYLNVRYRLPLTAYGSDLKKAVCDIAALMLMRGRGFNPEQADAEMLVTGSRDAVKWLEGIAAGKISPYGLTDASTAQANVEDSDASHGPFVVQPQSPSTTDDSFWGEGSSSDGGVGAPRRRGW